MIIYLLPRELKFQQGGETSASLILGRVSAGGDNGLVATAGDLMEIDPFA